MSDISGPFILMKDYIDAKLCSLRRHVDAIFAEREKTLAREVAVFDSQIAKLATINDQLSGQYSEFTAKLSDYVSRREYGDRHDLLIADMRRVETLLSHYVTIEEFRTLQDEVRKQGTWQANMTGRLWAMGILFGIVFVLVQTIIHIFGKS